MPETRIDHINKVTDEASVYVGTVEPQGAQVGDLFLNLKAAAFGTMTVITITGNVTLTAAHLVVLVDTSGGAITVSLPALSGIQETHYHISKINASANAVTIDPNGSELIQDVATLVFNAQWWNYHIIATPNFWMIL